MKTICAAAICLALMSPVLAQSLGEKSGVNSALGIAPKTEDFVKEATMSDMFEIQSSKLALEKQDTAATAFATQMIADHEKTSTSIKAIVQSGAVKADIPAAMSSSQQSMLDKLKALSGADFAKEYARDQVSAHKSAVSLYRRYGQKGDNKELKAFAAKTTPDLRHHLAMASQLAK